MQRVVLRFALDSSSCTGPSQSPTSATSLFGAHSKLKPGSSALLTLPRQMELRLWRGTGASRELSGRAGMGAPEDADTAIGHSCRQDLRTIQGFASQGSLTATSVEGPYNRCRDGVLRGAHRRARRPHRAGHHDRSRP